MSRRLVQGGVIALAIVVAVGTGWQGNEPAGEPEQSGTAVSTSPGDLPFDFFVLALSWSPTFCATEAGRGAQLQCGPGADFGFITHGLWPQFERGWPSYCQSTHGERLPDAIADDLLAIMPDRGLIQHQWDKHGTCSGLSPTNYAALIHQATQQIALPETFERGDGGTMNASTIEASFLASNPGLTHDGIALTCPNRRFAEVRICLDHALQPRACAEVDQNGCQANGLSVPAR